MLVMVEAMGHLPSGPNGVGSKESRSRLNNLAYIAYWKDTGLDMWTKQPPKADWLRWVQDEVRKEEQKN